jgi:hypothetical protein
MKPDDLLKLLVALTGATGASAGSASPSAPAAQAPATAQSILPLILGAFLGRQLPGQPAGAPQAPLSPIDNALGGQVLAGKKTGLAIVAYVILSIFQAMGLAGTATGPLDPSVAAARAAAEASAAAKPAAATTTPSSVTTTTIPAPAKPAATTSTTTTTSTQSVSTAPEGRRTPTGEILTTLIAAFGGLGLLGKFDRIIQALGLIGVKSSA